MYSHNAIKSQVYKPNNDIKIKAESSTGASFQAVSSVNTDGHMDG